MYDKKIQPPFVPRVDHPFDCGNFDKQFTSQPAIDSEVEELTDRATRSVPDEVVPLFTNFSFDCEAVKSGKINLPELATCESSFSGAWTGTTVASPTELRERLAEC